ncbi:MAG: PAS domain S-box protein, partial [Ignavibacteriaceae bacterium]
MKKKVKMKKKLTKRHKTFSQSFQEVVYQSVFHHSFDAVFILNAASRTILEINECATKTLGYSADELIGKNFSILFPEDHEATVENILKELHAFDAVLSGQQFLCKDGSTLAMDVTGLVEELNEEKCIIIFLRKAKDRNYVEQKLFFNNELFHGLMEYLPDYIYIKDKQGKFLSINKALLHFFGETESPDPEPSGRDGSHKNVSQLVPHSFSDSIAKEDTEILQTGKMVLNRIDHLKNFKDGKDLWMLTTKVPIFNHTGEIIGLIGISRDITNSKNEMEELARGEELYSVLFNMSPIGILLEDEKGTILEVNKAYCNSVGFTAEELIGKSVALFASPESLNKMEENVKRILSGEILIQEVENTGKDGIKRTLELRESKVTLTGGKNGILVIANDITERKEAEQKLQHESDLLRNLMDDIPDTIYFKDKESRFIRINAAQKKVLGLKSENESLGKTDFDFFPTSHASAALIDEQNIIRTGKPMIGKLENIRTSDGSYRWVSATKVPLLSEDGSIKGIVGISHDVTDLKNLEEESRKSEEKYRFMFEHTPIGFFIFNADQTITECNEKIVEILHSTREKLIGLNMKALRDKSISPAIEKALSGEDAAFEGWYKATTSTASIYATLKTTPLYDTNKKVIGGMGIVDDITEQKKAELEIRKSENHFRSIWENSFDGMRVIDENGMIRSVNKAFCEIVKKPKEELIGKHYSTVYEERLRTDFTLKGDENIKSKTVPLHYERKLQLWDSSNVWLEVINSFIEISDDENYLLSIFRNISERKLAEEKSKIYLEELKELNKSKDKFFSIVAHDLKSPFQGLLGLSEILLEDYSEMSDDQIIQYLKMIRATTKDVYRLIENLLDWSRLQSGRMEYSPETLDLFNASTNIINLLFPTAAKKNITLNTSVPGGTLVLADGNMLRSILQNLISNAIKFTKAEGKISVSAKSKDDFIEIKVKDTGIGLAENDIQKLFKLDEHFSRKGTSDESGTGLGLLLVKDLIEKHG